MRCINDSDHSGTGKIWKGHKNYYCFGKNEPKNRWFVKHVEVKQRPAWLGLWRSVSKALL